MASDIICPHLDAPSVYIDRKSAVPEDEQRQQMAMTTTLYVGNLSFYTTEEQIYEVFSKAGEVKRIIMGLDRYRKTPCGFCFVEYYTRKDAEDAMKYVNGMKLDERIVRADWDRGFTEGRQFGRGRTGGQIRDDYRKDYDSGRGGWGTYVDRMQE